MPHVGSEPNRLDPDLLQSHTPVLHEGCDVTLSRDIALSLVGETEGANSDVAIVSRLAEVGNQHRLPRAEIGPPRGIS